MLHIIKYKGCKRCRGDLFVERDYEGVYVSCLQCGASYARQDEIGRKKPGKVPVH